MGNKYFKRTYSKRFKLYRKYPYRAASYKAYGGGLFSGRGKRGSRKFYGGPRFAPNRQAALVRHLIRRYGYVGAMQMVYGAAGEQDGNMLDQLLVMMDEDEGKYDFQGNGGNIPHVAPLIPPPVPNYGGLLRQQLLNFPHNTGQRRPTYGRSKPNLVNYNNPNTGRAIRNDPANRFRSRAESDALANARRSQAILSDLSRSTDVIGHKRPNPNRYQSKKKHRNIRDEPIMPDLEDDPDIVSSSSSSSNRNYDLYEYSGVPSSLVHGYLGDAVRYVGPQRVANAVQGVVNLIGPARFERGVRAVGGLLGYHSDIDPVFKED